MDAAHAQANALASFVPAPVVARCARPLSPTAEATPTVVVLADCSGFTRLTAELTARGAEGVEELTTTLNSYFAALIPLLDDAGLVVAKFAGDAIIAYAPDAPGTLGRAVACALACVDAIAALAQPMELHCAVGCANMQHLEVGSATRREFVLANSGFFAELGTLLSLVGRSGVGVMADLATRLPDAVRVVETHESGLVVEAAGDSLESLSALGGSVLAERDAQLRADILAVSSDPEGLARLSSFCPEIVARRHADFLAELRHCTTIFLAFEALEIGLSREDGLLFEDAGRIVCETAHEFEGVVRQITQDDKSTVAIMCFGLPPRVHADDPARAVRATLALRQRLLDRDQRLQTSAGITTGKVYAGVVGTAVRREYAVVGHPVNTAARLMGLARDSIFCDQATRDAIKPRGTGLKFEWLRDVALKGLPEPVPVFRPIALAIDAGGDEGAAATATDDDDDDEDSVCLGRVSEKKAIAEFLAAFEQEEPAAPAVASPNLLHVHGANRAAKQRQMCRMLVLEGESGSGKTSLLQWAAAEAQGRGLQVVGSVGARRWGDLGALWIEPIQQLVGDRDVLDLLGMVAIGAAPASRPVSQASRASRRPMMGPVGPVVDSQRLVRLAPLLRDVFPQYAHLEETPYTRVISGSVRGAVIRELLLHLVAVTTQNLPGGTLLILDDLDQADSLSMLLLRDVIKAVPRHQLAVLAAPARHDLKAQQLQVPPLNTYDLQRIVRRRLGIRDGSVPPALLALLKERTRGNVGFLSESLAYLVDIEMVSADGRWVGTEEQLARLELPTSVDRLVAARLGALSEDAQLVIKVASVIGNVSFPLSVLENVFPLKGDDVRERVSKLVAETVAHGLLVADFGGSSLVRVSSVPSFAQSTPKGMGTPASQRRLGDGASSASLQRLATGASPGPPPAPSLYRFKEAIFMAVVYEMMMPSQQRELHEAIAWHMHESAAATGERRDHAALARHFVRARVTGHAITYLDQAAHHALAVHAVSEAASLFGQLIELAESEDGRERCTDEQVGEWLAGLGQAKLALGFGDEARDHFEMALVKLGARKKSSTLGKISQVLGAVRDHVRSRPRLLRTLHAPDQGDSGEERARAAKESPRLLVVAGVLKELMQLEFMRSDTLAVLQCLFGYIRYATAAYAEDGVPSEILISGIAALSAAVSIGGLLGTAKQYIAVTAALSRQRESLGLDSELSMAIVEQFQGVFWAMVGSTSKASEVLHSSLTRFLEAGDTRHADELRMILLSVTILYQPGELGFAQAPSSVAMLDDLFDSAVKRDDGQPLLWRTLQAVVYWARFGPGVTGLDFVGDEALRSEMLELADGYAERIGLDKVEPLDRLILHAVRGLLCESSEELVRAGAVLATMQPGVFGVGEALLAVKAALELVLATRMRKDMLDLAARVVRHLGAHAGAIQLIRPQHTRAKAYVALVQGRRGRAKRLFVQAAELSRKLIDDPFDLYAAYFELCRTFPDDKRSAEWEAEARRYAERHEGLWEWWSEQVVLF